MLIVRQLSCRDLYSLMSTCKGFWAWGSTIEFVELFEGDSDEWRPCPIRSFLVFQRTRMSSGLEVSVHAKHRAGYC